MQRQQEQTVEIIIEDNKILRDICGQSNENLSKLQQKLSIKISNIGNKINLQGENKQLNIAKIIIEQLIEQSKSKNYISSQDIDLLLLNLPQQNSFNKIAISSKKTKIYPKNSNQAKYMQLLNNAQILFAIGPAGTGKTHLAVAHAVQALEKGLIEKIIISRPAVESGEKLGFLPGDLKEKVDPYLRPIYDSLYDMMSVKRTHELIENSVIEIAPLAFMRGRSFNNAIIILDEAQNTTSAQMKMFLTRLGEGSRMIIAGDISQIDLSNNQISGLKEALEILQNIPQIDKIFFTKQDIVRHPLVNLIVEAYNNHAAN